jgi:hypothetical protein
VKRNCKSHIPFRCRSECNAKNALKGDFRSLRCRIKFVLIQSAWQKVVSPQALHAIKRIRFFDQGDSLSRLQLSSCNTSSAPRENAASGVSFSTGWVHIKFIIMHRAQGNLFRKPSSPAGERTILLSREKGEFRNKHTPTRLSTPHFSADLNMAIFLRPDVSGSFRAQKGFPVSRVHANRGARVRLGCCWLLCVYTHSLTRLPRKLSPWADLFIRSACGCAAAAQCTRPTPRSLH